MANISISEVYGNTQSQRIQNDDLFLMSLHDSTNNTYTSAGINGLQMKCCMALPSIEYLKTFRHTEVTVENIAPSTLEIDNQYIASYQVNLPVDSFVHINGEFVLDNYTAWKSSGMQYSTQWLVFCYSANNNTIDHGLTLDPQICSYVDDGVIKERKISFWSGYAKAGSKFGLWAVLPSAQIRTDFLNHFDQTRSYLQISYFDPSQNS